MNVKISDTTESNSRSRFVPCFVIGVYLCAIAVLQGMLGWDCGRGAMEGVIAACEHAFVGHWRSWLIVHAVTGAMTMLVVLCGPRRWISPVTNGVTVWVSLVAACAVGLWLLAGWCA